jgi:hypothetical protein
VTHRREPALIAATVVVVVGAAATAVLFSVRATAGWTDQSGYHWPTIAKMIRELPSIDVVNVKTATGPLYHLSLAVPARVLALPEGAVQLLSAMYGCVLAALVIVAGRGMPLAPRFAASGLVLLSPYFWESTLWMATDVAAMTFAFAALVVLVRPQLDRRHALLVGLLVAGAVGVRQTFGWLVAVAAIGLWLSNPSKSTKARLLDIAAGTVPGAVVLAALVIAWKGLVPPSFVPLNATHHSPAGLTYMFALAGCYITPLVLALGRDVWGRRSDWPTSLAVGIVAAVPGVIFASSEFAGEEKPRSGGWLWVLVARAPAPSDRSILLVGLALLGGVGFTLLALHIARTNSPRVALVLGVALATSAMFASAGSQMYQKYYEIPLVVIVFLVTREAFRDRHQVTNEAAGERPPVSRGAFKDNPRHAWAFAVSPAMLQVCAVVAIVGLPFVRALA